MKNRNVSRMTLAIDLIVDEIRTARGITGGSGGTDELDQLLLKITEATSKLRSWVSDKEHQNAQTQIT